MPRVLFKNAAVFDGETPGLAHGMSVLVDGAEIAAVECGQLDVDDAQDIDCAGKTLMPGLIDAHVHIYAESTRYLSPPWPPPTFRAQYANRFLRHALSCGITTVRDVAGGDHGMAMALRERFLDGPRFFYGGLALSQTGGHGDFRPQHQDGAFSTCCVEHNVFAVIADGVEACAKATREELRKGANHIKIMASGGVISPTDPIDRCQYSEAEIRAIVEEAERHGAYVCAHCHPAEAIRRCVEYGVRCIEHGTLIDEPTAAFVAEHGAFVVPTLAILFALIEEGANSGLPQASLDKLRRVADGALKGLEIMKAAGVRMGLGTDLFGHQLVRQGSEYAIRAQALSTFDVLHSATTVNAEIVQMKGRLGVVKPGALADLIVVDGDPLADPGLLAANGTSLTHIMVDGRFAKAPASEAISP